MTREVKFRARALKTGQWQYGYYSVNIDGAPIITSINEHRVVTEIVFVDPKTVCEGTGLKDSKAKEIYEGDIVNEGFHSLYEISKGYAGKDLDDEPECWIGMPIGKDNNDDIFGLSLSQAKYCEISGNIYENPELLK